MTGPDLRIIDQDFSDAILSMGKIENAFSSMGRNFLEYFPITGHLGLSTCMSSFESDWENKRHDLTETLKSYRKQLKQVQDIFTRVDNKIGEKTQPHGTTTQPPGKTTQPPGKTQPSTPPSGQTPSGSTPPGSGTDGGATEPLPQTGSPATGGGGGGSGVGGGGGSGVGGGGVEALPHTGSAIGSADSGLSGGSDSTLPDSGGTDKLPQTGNATTAGNPSLDESQYPAVGKMREMLGNAANVSLVSSSDGSLSMKIGSVSGLSLAAVTAVLAKRGATGTSRDSTNAFGIVEESSRAGASSSAALREALSSLNSKDSKVLPSETPGPDRDSILEDLLGEGPEDGDNLKGGGLPLDSQTPAEATDPLGGPLQDASAETAAPATRDTGLPETGLPETGGLDGGSLSSGLSDPLPLPDSGGPLTDGGPSGSLTGGIPAAPDTTGVDTTSTSSPLAGPLPTSPSTAAPATTPKDTSHTSAPMLSGMGMAAGLGAGSAVQSGNEDKRNEEARRLRDQLLTLKEKD